MHAIGVEIVFILVANNGLVINVLRRNVHQCKWQSPLCRTNVAGGDFVNALAYVFEEIFARGFLVCLRLSPGDAPEVFQGKLGIDGHHALVEAQHRIGNVAGGKLVLHAELFARKHAGQQVLELSLAETSTQLRRA